MSNCIHACYVVIVFLMLTLGSYCEAKVSSSISNVIDEVDVDELIACANDIGEIDVADACAFELLRIYAEGKGGAAPPLNAKTLIQSLDGRHACLFKTLTGEDVAPPECMIGMPEIAVYGFCLGGGAPDQLFIKTGVLRSKIYMAFLLGELLEVNDSAFEYVGQTEAERVMAWECLEKGIMTGATDDILGAALAWVVSDDVGGWYQKREAYLNGLVDDLIASRPSAVIAFLGELAMLPWDYAGKLEWFEEDIVPKVINLFKEGTSPDIVNAAFMVPGLAAVSSPSGKAVADDLFIAMQKPFTANPLAWGMAPFQVTLGEDEVLTLFPSLDNAYSTRVGLEGLVKATLLHALAGDGHPIFKKMISELELLSSLIRGYVQSPVLYVDDLAMVSDDAQIASDAIDKWFELMKVHISAAEALGLMMPPKDEQLADILAAAPYALICGEALDAFDADPSSADSLPVLVTCGLSDLLRLGSSSLLETIDLLDSGTSGDIAADKLAFHFYQKGEVEKAKKFIPAPLGGDENSLVGSIIKQALAGMDPVDILGGLDGDDLDAAVFAEKLSAFKVVAGLTRPTDISETIAAYQPFIGGDLASALALRHALELDAEERLAFFFPISNTQACEPVLAPLQHAGLVEGLMDQVVDLLYKQGHDLEIAPWEQALAILEVAIDYNSPATFELKYREDFASSVKFLAGKVMNRPGFEDCKVTLESLAATMKLPVIQVSSSGFGKPAE